MLLGILAGDELPARLARAADDGDSGNSLTETVEQIDHPLEVIDERCGVGGQGLAVGGARRQKLLDLAVVVAVQVDAPRGQLDALPLVVAHPASLGSHDEIIDFNGGQVVGLSENFHGIRFLSVFSVDCCTGGGGIPPYGYVNTNRVICQDFLYQNLANAHILPSIQPCMCCLE